MGNELIPRRLDELTEDDVVTMMLGRALRKEATIYQAIPLSEQAALSVKDITVPWFSLRTYR